VNPLPPSRDVIRVFLLDDHEIVRRGLTEVINTEPDLLVVGEAGTMAEALRRIPATTPHVAVLDARLPDGTGIEVCRELRATRPEINSLILTSYDDDAAVLAALVAGAAGYVLKHIRVNTLLDGIRRVAAGESLLDPDITAVLLARIRAGSATNDQHSTSPRLAMLTDSERAILSLITEGMTNKQIGERLFIAEQTVKNRVSRLLAKLGMARRTQIAAFGANLNNNQTASDSPTVELLEDTD
jgi:two-component system response regulator DevR